VIFEFIHDQRNKIDNVVYDNYDRLSGITYAGYVIAEFDALEFEF
jgi:hypothetical protein